MYMKHKVSHLQLIWLMGQSEIVSRFSFGRRICFSVLESCVIRDGVSRMMMEITCFNAFCSAIDWWPLILWCVTFQITFQKVFWFHQKEWWFSLLSNIEIFQLYSFLMFLTTLFWNIFLAKEEKVKMCRPHLTQELCKNPTGGIVQVTGSLGINNVMGILLAMSSKLLAQWWITRENTLNLDLLICISSSVCSCLCYFAAKSDQAEGRIQQLGCSARRRYLTWILLINRFLECQ